MPSKSTQSFERRTICLGRAPFSFLGYARKQAYPHTVALTGRVSIQFHKRACIGTRTHKWQLRYHHTERGEEVDGEVGEIVVRVMRAQEKQDDGHTEKEFLGGRVLCAVVDLLPHVEVIVGAAVELERCAAHVVEHYVRTDHV